VVISAEKKHKNRIKIVCGGNFYVKNASIYNWNTIIYSWANIFIWHRLSGAMPMSAADRQMFETTA
jgi:hypothetical protein